MKIKQNIYIGVVGISIFFSTMFVSLECFSEEKEVSNVRYLDSEVESTKQSISNCILLNISKILLDYFKANNVYPNEKHWVKEVFRGMGEKRTCLIPSSFFEGKILDAYNDPIVYQKKSDSEVVLYSTNVLVESNTKFYGICLHGQKFSSTVLDKFGR